MEKTGNAGFVVYNEGGEIKMRLPGGEVIGYDGRFGDYFNSLSEGETKEINW